MGGFGKDPIPGFRAPVRLPASKSADTSERIGLRVLNGPCIDRIFEIGGARSLVGRGDPPVLTVDLDLESCELGTPAMVSRRHAELIWIDGKLHVVDLGSRNGTWVDEQPVGSGDGSVSEPKLLAIGSKLRLANLELDGSITWITGSFERVRPPEHLAYTWNVSIVPGDATLVIVDFRDHPQGTEVVIRHERFGAEAVRDMHLQGWGGCLDKLEVMFEPQSGGDHS